MVSARSCPCACGADLADAPRGPVWTFDTFRAEYRHCGACGSSRAFIPDVAGPVVVCGVLRVATFHEALEHAPATLTATIQRGAVVLATAEQLDGGALVWNVAPPASA